MRVDSGASPTELFEQAQSSGISAYLDEIMPEPRSPEDRSKRGAEDDYGELIDPDDIPDIPRTEPDPTSLYFKEMGKIHLLDRQTELEIARRIENGKKNVFDVLSGTLYLAHVVI